MSHFSPLFLTFENIQFVYFWLGTNAKDSNANEYNEKKEYCSLVKRLYDVRDQLDV